MSDNVRELFDLLMMRLHTYETDLSHIKASVNALMLDIKDVERLKSDIRSIERDIDQITNALKRVDDRTMDLIRVAVDIEALHKWRDGIEKLDLTMVKRYMEENKPVVVKIQEALEELTAKISAKSGNGGVTGTAAGTAAGICGAVIIDFISKSYGGLN